MREAHVRFIEVKGQKYVQVVQYSTKLGERFRVCRSFGQVSYENRMRAELYAAAYNALVKMVVKAEGVFGVNTKPYYYATLATFGFILEAKTVEEILEAKN